MEKKKIIISILVVVILLIIILWFSGIIPKQIAKIYGTNYMKKYFPISIGQGIFDIEQTYRENYVEK